MHAIGVLNHPCLLILTLDALHQNTAKVVAGSMTPTTSLHAVPVGVPHLNIGTCCQLQKCDVHYGPTSPQEAARFDSSGANCFTFNICLDLK